MLTHEPWTDWPCWCVQGLTCFLLHRAPLNQAPESCATNRHRQILQHKNTNTSLQYYYNQLHTVLMHSSSLNWVNSKCMLHGISKSQIQTFRPLKWKLLKYMFGETTWGSTGSQTAPVPIIDFRCDFLLELHKVVVGKRAGHNLRAVLDQAVGHLLNVPEQRGLVALVCRRTGD